jgi:hypothetical protein
MGLLGSPDSLYLPSCPHFPLLPIIAASYPHEAEFRLIQSLERLGDASHNITSAANSQVEKLMGGVTKRSGSKSPSDPLMLSRFAELRVCMLTYCGNNSRITIAANAGANRFSVIHKLWDDVTSLDLTVKPKLNLKICADSDDSQDEDEDEDEAGHESDSYDFDANPKPTRETERQRHLTGVQPG